MPAPMVAAPSMIKILKVSLPGVTITNHCQPDSPRLPWSLIQPADMSEPKAEERTLPKKKMEVRLVNSAHQTEATRTGVPSRVYQVFKVYKLPGIKPDSSTGCSVDVKIQHSLPRNKRAVHQPALFWTR